MDNAAGASRLISEPDASQASPGLQGSDFSGGVPRDQLNKVRAMLGQQAVGIAQIAKETGLTRQTVYRIKDDPAGAEAALAAWGM